MTNKFYDSYKAVFDAVKTNLEFVATVPAVPAHDEEPEVPGVPAHGVASLKSVVLGEQFTYGNYPKAIINALPSPMTPSAVGSRFEVQVNFSVVVVIQDYEPKDWFVDIIKPMGDVVDAIIADPSLGGVCRFVYPTSFSPGEIKFKEKILYGGQVSFSAFKSFTVT